MRHEDEDSSLGKVQMTLALLKNQTCKGDSQEYVLQVYNSKHHRTGLTIVLQYALLGFAQGQDKGRALAAIGWLLNRS